jgi:DNA modification methylase
MPDMTEPARLTANPRNPNRMSDEDKVMMRKALAEFGDLGGIVYNRRSGYLLGGHQRFSVMEGAELTVDDLREPEPDGTVARGYLTHKGRRYAVRVVDWPEEKANRAMIAANRFGRLGQDEMSVLKDLLQELDTGATDMETTGYTAAALEELMTQVPPETEVDAEAQVDKADELRVKWGVERGQVWTLGDHRLMCGDSTSAEDVGRLLGGAVPFLCVTDPPYGVEYDANWRNEADRANGKPYGATAVGKVTNDDRADWADAWRLFPGDVIYVWHAGTKANTVADSLIACGFAIRAQIIWAKNQMVIGRGNYHTQHEPCWYCVREGKAASFTDDRTQTTLWEIDKPHKSETGHSTQKPVECMARAIRNHPTAAEVYEPFSGSGTTIIACEQLHRRCFAMEIAPGYVAVALQRWADATGKTPCLT